MRPQKRSFVVEIKSKGRRASARQGSIWGTTDLKPIARQAAGDAPRLFDQSDESATQTTDTPAIVSGETASRDMPSPSSSAALPIYEVISDSETVAREIGEDLIGQAFTALVDENETTPARHRKPKPQVRRRASKVGAKSQVDQFRSGSDDELTFLEVENAELRSRYGALLREQNAQLRAMLARIL